MRPMNVPPLGTALPLQIIDNSLPGHTITQLTSTINDIGALQTYLQASLTTFTQLFYYPEQMILQIQTLGDTADSNAIIALVQAYSNPFPVITKTENFGITPVSCSSSNWKTVFVLNSQMYDDKRLVEATVSSALTPVTPNTLLSQLQYSVRIVAVDTNTILGVVIAGNDVFETQNITLTNVPPQSFSLEVQIQTQGGVFVTLRSISLTYQLN